MAARVAGITFLLTNVTAMFASFYVESKLIDVGNLTKTAANITSSERLFRIGIASDLFTFAAVIPLIVALYVILKPVSRSLALLALCWGIIETSVFVVGTLNNLDVVRILSGAAYLHAFDSGRLHVLMRLSIGAHGAAYNVALLFFGLRSTMFSYLFLTSRFIPKMLASLGLFSSLLVTLCSFLFIVFPSLADSLEPGIYIPILGFEVVTGFWLLFVGFQRPQPGSLA